MRPFEVECPQPRREVHIDNGAHRYYGCSIDLCCVLIGPLFLFLMWAARPGQETICPVGQPDFDPGYEWRGAKHYYTDKQFLGYNCAALKLARNLSVFLQRSSLNPSQLVLLYESRYARSYDLPDQRVLKVQKYETIAEAVLAKSLPDIKPLLKASDVAVCTLDDNNLTADRFIGQLSRPLRGEFAHSAIRYPEQFSITSEQILQVALDLSMALHALHFGIRNYIIFHCGIRKENVRIKQSPSDEPELPWRAVLMEYGNSIVVSNETLYRDPSVELYSSALSVQMDGCFASTLTKRGVTRTTQRRYGLSSQWRELGLMLYELCDGPTPIHLGINETTDEFDAEMTIRRNIVAATHSEELQELLTYLILEHMSIRDEVADVLKHPSFSKLTPRPHRRTVTPIEPQAEFTGLFARHATYLLYGKVQKTIQYTDPSAGPPVQPTSSIRTPSGSIQEVRRPPALTH
eukprot:TRINITY_DN14587_c0_g1_i1.p1 TRINITY_DN14587_c0_g1~~TRINITY_DN14587_c0_g1_i1.p1  ORF type:complete len:462 (+),score=30.29 TRINITY_DN14587_c0_g1_i1:58-1443(+)